MLLLLEQREQFKQRKSCINNKLMICSSGSDLADDMAHQKLLLQHYILYIMS